MANANILNGLKEWISRNWAWLLFIGCVFLLGQINQDDRAFYFFVLFLFPLGLMIWFYWNKSYSIKFQEIETERKSIDNRLHYIRTKKQNSSNLFGLLQECDTDYKILEAKEKSLQTQKERDVVVFVCAILLIYLVIIPFAIGLLGWNNIIEMFSSYD
jgi:hypothetical protein